ncbi:MAG: hypothetical protein A2017_02665 [Lentisphaerae bacterium GWF2_44_16]|nr:MAG: hypothetical protein A2017_02665 [Lentisphaerae bacterium GWF2_44_16]
MDTEKKILYAASEEFAKNGYYGTTIRKICKRAKVNVAAVNYHFDSKESLYRKVFSFLFEETEVDKLLLPLQTHSDEEAKSALKNWIKGFLGVLVNPDKLNEFKFKIMFREMLDPTDIFQQIFMEFIKPRISVVENYLRKKLPPGTPYEEICIYQFSITAQCLFYFNNRITVSYLSEDKSFPRNSVEKIADFITESIWFNLEKYRK